MLEELRFIPNAAALRILSDLTTSIDILFRSFTAVVETPEVQITKELNNLNFTEKDILTKAGGNFFFYRKDALKACVAESLAKAKETLENLEAVVPEIQAKYHACIKDALGNIDELISFVSAEQAALKKTESKAE